MKIASIRSFLSRLNQDGSLMLMTIMVLLVVSILGAAVITTAGMEGKMSAYNGRILQAQQAADAGIAVNIDKVTQFLQSSSGTIPSDKKTDSGIISNGPPIVRYNVTIDDSGINSTGVVKIVSTGEVVGNAGEILSKKKITALVNYTGESRYPLRSNSIVVNGATSVGANNDTFNINGDKAIATSNYDPNHLASTNATVETDYLPAVLTQNDVARMAELIKKEALSAGSKWNYLNPSVNSNTYSLTESSLSSTRPYLFVDIPQNKTLEVNMGGSALDNSLMSTLFEFITTGGNNIGTAVIVSPAPIVINFGIFNDNMPDPSYLFVMSPKDITLNFNAELIGAYTGSDTVRIYTLSGNDITLNANTKEINIIGSLNAANSTNVNFREGLFGLSAAQTINFTPDQDITNSFPYNWALIRVGAVTSYNED